MSNRMFPNFQTNAPVLLTPKDMNNSHISFDSQPSAKEMSSGRSIAQSLIRKREDVKTSKYAVNLTGILPRLDHPFPCTMMCNTNQNDPWPLKDKRGHEGVRPEFKEQLKYGRECGPLREDLQEAEIKLGLRGELPYYTRKQICDIRLPFYQVLCHDLLENGYHYAFTELFQLHRAQMEARRKAGADSALWTKIPLSEQHEKLYLIRDCLIRAEAAMRRMDEHTVYSSYMCLVQAFEKSTDDQWLREHFIRYALVVAERIGDDNGLKLALGYMNYGQAKETRGELDKSAVNYAACFKACKDMNWTSPNSPDKLLYNDAADHLVRVYLKMVDSCEPDQHSDRLEYCKRAHDIASAVSDWRMEAEVCDKMGQLLEACGRVDEALTFYRGYFDLAKRAGDKRHLGLACEAIAKLYQSRPWSKTNRIGDCINFLQKFVQLCEQQGDLVELTRAYQLIGQVSDAAGDYVSAIMWTKKASQVQIPVNTVAAKCIAATKEAARIMTGVTRAHLFNPRYMTNLLANSRESITKCINWKAHPVNEAENFPQVQPEPILIGRQPKRNPYNYTKASNPTDP